MADATLRTADLHGLLDRIRAGDRLAQDELVRACQDRLEAMAGRMLRKFPTVRRWADTGDVFQNAVLRLLRSLQAVRPADTREFFNLAAAQMRRELIDLARHFGGPHGIGANHASVGGDVGGPNGAAGAADGDPAELDRWTALHEAAERLPAAERETFGLVFYHGWTHAQGGGTVPGGRAEPCGGGGGRPAWRSVPRSAATCRTAEWRRR